MVEIVEERTYLQHGVQVREGDVVLDVGANVGVSAVFFAAECGAARVHSFEPVPELFELLVRNTHTVPECVPHGYGIYRESGRRELIYYPRSASMSSIYANPAKDSAMVRDGLVELGWSKEAADAEVNGRFRPEVIECEMLTISAALEAESVGDVDLLKIDVEGAELDVIASVAEADWPRIKQLAMEIHDGAACRSIEETLRDHGFDVSIDTEPVMRGTPVRMLYATRT